MGDFARNQQPLFLARTEGSTPSRFSLHVGDVSHTLIIGPTGARKSVLLALMGLQFSPLCWRADLVDPGGGARNGRRLA
jgi:type IV secretory pathway VirB4 component